MEHTPTEEQVWLAEQRFRCVQRDGCTFPLVVRIGQPVPVPGQHLYSRCWIALEPLAHGRWGPGSNAFQALCLSLDYIRTVFKIFTGEGGRIYWEETDSLVDLDSPWFAPYPNPHEIGLIGDAGRAPGVPQ